MNKIKITTEGFANPQFTSGWMYLTDRDDLPCSGEVQLKRNNIICTSTEESFALNLLQEVPGFGKVMLRTNVFNPLQERTVGLLDTLIEARQKQVTQKIDSIHNSDRVAFSQRLEDLISSPNSVEKLSRLLQLGEDIVVGDSKRLLQKRIVSREMNDFLIGGQAFGIRKGNKFKTILRENFDLGVAPFYFFLIKPNSQDHTDWELTDEIVDWLVKNNKVIKGHPMVWLHKYARPSWMLSLTFPELKDFLRDHITQLIERYGDRIKMWDIVNEMPCADANGFDLDMSQILELVKMISDLVKKLQPEAERIMNFSEIFGAHTWVHDKPGVPPTHFVQRCIDHGIEFESIGLQFYAGMKAEFNCRELLDISDTIDGFLKFGKRIHFAELGWPSQHDVDPHCFFSTDHPEVAGRWHKPWDENLQAEFLEKIYTLFASKPNSWSITWWDLTDNGTNKDIGSRFIPFSGLTRRDFSFKPAMLKLQNFRQLLHSNI